MRNNNSELIVNYLNNLYPEVKCFLNYSKDYELLIAVMLSAQTTDKAVNSVTSVLFSKYKTLKSLGSARVFDVEEIIKSIGMYKVKAKNVVDIANGLLTKFNGVVPSNKEDLMSLPGVGNKTANVVLNELYKKEEFPVDTHIFRFSKRLNIAKESDDVIVAEEKLKKYFENYSFYKLHHQIILFGRNICNAKKPNCKNCGLVNICKYKNKNLI